jgi:DNA-binding transcriptional MocR family regulator
MPDQISFARGAPSLDIIAVADLAAAAGAAFASDPGGAFSYGTSGGYPPLRQWIAGRHHLSAEQVMVTNGSMQAAAFLFELLVHDGDVVVVEAPTYDRTLLSLQRRGAKILPIPLEQDGIDVSALEAALQAGARPRLAHIIPTFQNPAGCTLSQEKRQRLLALAEQYDFVIFEDDPYIELRFEGERLPTMLSLDRNDRVVYASSFTKTVCPGVRVGYLAGPAAVIARTAKIATETYISPSMVTESIVNQFCRSGAIETSIETVTLALRERLGALVAALTRELPEARFTAPAGGYFLWVDLPATIDVDDLFAAALDRGVVFVKGDGFLLDGGRHSLRLAFSGVGVAEIDEGVARLADAYRSLAPA